MFKGEVMKEAVILDILHVWFSIDGSEREKGIAFSVELHRGYTCFPAIFKVIGRRCLDPSAIHVKIS